MRELKEKRRRFLAPDLEISTIADVEPYTQDLIDRPIENVKDYRRFLRDAWELDGLVDDTAGKLGTAVSLDLSDKAALRKSEQFDERFLASWRPLENAINTKILESPFAKDVKIKGFDIYLQKLQMDKDVFCEKNSALETKDSVLSTKYEKIVANKTVKLPNRKRRVSLTSAAEYLADERRDKREGVWRSIQSSYKWSQNKFDDLFDQMVKTRHRIARNAGCENYVEYAYKTMYRFDYGPETCKKFQHAIADVTLPVIRREHADMANRLGYDMLRPWDISYDEDAEQNEKACKLLRTTLQRFVKASYGISDKFGASMALIKNTDNFDIFERTNKSAQNSTTNFFESGIPFVNACFTATSTVPATLFHEGAHAHHYMNMQHLPSRAMTDPPSEVMELFAMAYEFISFDQWPIFYHNMKNTMNAQAASISENITLLPYYAQIDAFQHAVYEKPNMSPAKRNDLWLELDHQYSDDGTDWNGLERERSIGWHQIGNIFQSPFYFIEYAMAELGAAQLWNNYLHKPGKTLAQMERAMRLGATESVPEIYKAAGISFDLSKKNVKRQVDFLVQQQELLKQGIPPGSKAYCTLKYAA